MYDSDSDGRITLEEYRNVKYAPAPAGPSASPALRPGWRPKFTASLLHRQVVEELLSGNPHIEKESARSIADGAMMEAASVCVGRMVRAAGAGPPDRSWKWEWESLFPSYFLRKIRCSIMLSFE